MSKEFPNWFSKAKKQRFRDIDFDDATLRGYVDEMVASIDAFTDQEGKELTDRINATREEQVLVGYRARGENHPDKVAPKPFGHAPMDSQIGEGLYVAKDRGVAVEYAQQYVAQGMIGVVQEVYLNVASVKTAIQLKGISVKRWWKQYEKTNDDTWDVVVAAISGKVGTIQYKINPKHKASGLFELVDVERLSGG